MNEDSSRRRLEKAVEELAAFADGRLPREHFVTTVRPAGGEGTTFLGYPDYRPAMDALWDAFFRAGLNEVTPETYNAYLATEEEPLAEPGAISRLGREELLVRLFAIRRAERFCDGYWTSQLERGLLLAYARRLLDFTD